MYSAIGSVEREGGLELEISPRARWPYLAGPSRGSPSTPWPIWTALTSNGPEETIDGRIEHLCGSALGFRNPTNHIARSMFDTGESSPGHTRD